LDGRAIQKSQNAFVNSPQWLPHRAANRMVAPGVLRKAFGQDNRPVNRPDYFQR
jgi:hypothetical protein